MNCQDYKAKVLSDFEKSAQPEREQKCSLFLCQKFTITINAKL